MMPTLHLDFLGPLATPIQRDLPMAAGEHIAEPYFATVTLLLVDDCAPALLDGLPPGLHLWVQYRPDAEADCDDSFGEWLSQRLTRIFNPDGSEPDFWRVRSDGLGLEVWVRNVELPPLDVTVDADVPLAERI